MILYVFMDYYSVIINVQYNRISYCVCIICMIYWHSLSLIDEVLAGNVFYVHIDKLYIVQCGNCDSMCSWCIHVDLVGYHSVYHHSIISISISYNGIVLYSDNYHFLHGFQVIRVGIFAKANEAENLQKKNSGSEGGN